MLVKVTHVRLMLNCVCRLKVRIEGEEIGCKIIRAKMSKNYKAITLGDRLERKKNEIRKNVSLCGCQKQLEHLK